MVERRTSRHVIDIERRLELAEHTLEAIRSGAVDAFLMQEGDDERVYPIETAWQPYRALIESMSQGALMVATDGMILFANRFFATMVGKGQDDLAGTPLTRHVVADDAFLVDQALASAGEREAEVDVHVKGSDGHGIPVRVSVAPIGRSQAQRCVIVADLTERRQFEALQRAQAALRQSEAKLREADRRKDEFLATLAHELRNPLVPLRNGLKILELAGTNADAAQRAQAMMRRQVQHMVRLIDDLLDVSRITLGKIELQMGTVRVDEVVREAVEAAQSLAEGRRHEVRVSCERRLFVTGDAVRLTQVFTNLLDNAGKYTALGGRIDVAVDQAGDDVVIRVRDTGRGIAREALPRVFDLFTRIAADGHEAGLGVGLSISRQLVGMHGGSLEARSDGPGQGSEFIVRLPLAAAPAGEAGPAATGAARTPRHSPLPAGRHRVLIAEDNLEAARSMALMLRMAGHDVREANDGAAAFELAEWFRPHLLLLDLRMPRMDGLEVSRRIRDEAWGRRMRIIGVTGWGPQTTDAMARAGLDDVVFKPMEPDALLALVAATPPDMYAGDDGA